MLLSCELPKATTVTRNCIFEQRLPVQLLALLLLYPLTKKEIWICPAYGHFIGVSKMKSPLLRGWANTLGSPLQPPVELSIRTDNSPRTVATRKSHRDRQFIFYRPTGWPLASSGASQLKGDKALYTPVNHSNQPAENPCADHVSLYLLFIFSLCKQHPLPHHLPRPIWRNHKGCSHILLPEEAGPARRALTNVTPSDDASHDCWPGGGAWPISGLQGFGLGGMCNA